MKSKLTMILRIVLAIVLLVFGASKFYSFMPAMEMPEPAGNFMMALMATGYMLKLVGATEIVVGLLLLLNKWTPFALVVLAPLSLNMLLFHVFLAPAGIGPAALVTLINTYLIYTYWKKFKTLF